MIEVYYTDSLDFLSVSGHADYSTSGKDIVCAGVSTLIFTCLNSLSNIDDFDIKIKEGNEANVEIKCKNEFPSTHDSIVMETILNGLKTISEKYPKFVKIKRR